MNGIRRRDLIGFLGVAVGAGVTPRRLQSVETPPSQSDQPGVSGDSRSWTYAPLDPARVGDKVYEIFAQGGCMYAVFGGILACHSEKAGNPIPAFPLHMMKYGAGGVGGWGTLCGALNGGAAIIGLFVTDKRRQDQLISDLFAWYERMKLPRYRPATADGQPRIVATTSRSVLCHVSVGAWCHESGFKVDSKEKTERCRRLTVDVATKTVKLLNAYSLGSQPTVELSPAAQARSNVEKGAIPGEAMGKMRCDSCHQPGQSDVNIGPLSETRRQ